MQTGTRFRPWLFLAMAFPLFCPPSLAAHPISKLHHERTVLIRVTEAAVLIEYALALDHWTMALDLVPFSADIDYAGDPKVLYQAYARIYAAEVARGLSIQLQGQELKPAYLGFQLQQTDHLRFTFQFRAACTIVTGPAAHTLRVIDSNFTLDPGAFRVAARGEGRVVIRASNVGTDPESAKPITLTDFDAVRAERARTADLVFSVDRQAILNTPVTADNSEAAGTPGFWDLIRAQDLRRLLDSDLGLGILLVLAFVFGTMHALQPGHGKTLVAAYLVGEQGTVGHAFFLGFVTTLTHTSTVFLLAIVVPEVYPNAGPEVVFALSLGCGVLVVLMAFWLLLRRLSGQADHVHLFGGQHHHHGDGDHHHHHAPPPGSRVGWGALVGLGVTGGLVPCVDALALLTATWVLRQPWLGLPLILAFSLGLASVLVLVGVLTVKFKRFATSKWGDGRFVRSLPIVSALLTLGLGIWMCQAALDQRGHLPSATSPVPAVSASPP